MVAGTQPVRDCGVAVVVGDGVGAAVRCGRKAAHGPAQQIYARQIFGHLRVFERAVPGAKNARDILEHFDEYARGVGQLQRKAMNELGIDVLEVAAIFWGGGYDPATEEISEGPFVVAISNAVEASQRLQMAIYHAARAVDASRGLV